MTDGEVAELLRLVLARPDDHEALRIYADALMLREDPRGELITVQLAAESPERANRERELTAQLSAALAARLEQDVTFEWRLGFIDTLDLAPSPKRTSLVDTFRELQSLPEARRVRRMVIRCVEPGWPALPRALLEFLRSSPRGLRELAIVQQARAGSSAAPMVLAIGDLGPLFSACPKIEALELEGGDYRLRSIEAPALRRLVLARAAPTDIANLAALPIPRLEELSIDHASSPVNEQWLGRLLNRELVHLRYLAFTTTEKDALRYLTSRIGTSALGRHLRVLALRGGALDATCVRMIRRDAEWYRKLERLDVHLKPGRDRRQLGEVLGDVLVVC